MNEPWPSSSSLPETVPLTRDQRRSRRRREVRSHTENLTRASRRHLEVIRTELAEHEDADIERPRTRADCIDGPRPCPWVGCRFNLYLDVQTETGNVKINFPDLAPDEMPAERSCALDIAAEGGVTLEQVGEAMNMTRERIRQIEAGALHVLLRKAQHFGIGPDDFFDVERFVREDE